MVGVNQLYVYFDIYIQDGTGAYTRTHDQNVKLFIIFFIEKERLKLKISAVKSIKDRKFLTHNNFRQFFKIILLNLILFCK